MQETIGPISSSASQTPLGIFVRRLVLTIVIIAIAVAFWRLIDVLVLLFGASLSAIGLHAAARGVMRLTGVCHSIALAAVILIVLIGVAAVSWVFGTMIVAQFENLIQAVPVGISLLLDRLRNSPYGLQLLEQARGVNVLGATSWATAAFTTVVRSVTIGIGYAGVTLFVAVYLAAQPERYCRLCLRLVPSSSRATITYLFDVTADILQRWLIGQVIIMTVIGLLSGIGLWLLGIEAAFTLGLIGGLLCFIPYVGAILAAVPATLVALTQGPLNAGAVVLMYACVHLIEGNFITPMIQAEATSLPPVLALLSTVAVSLLFGPSAVLLAAPLTLFLMSVIEILYVQERLGEPPEMPLGRSQRHFPGDHQ